MNPLRSADKVQRIRIVLAHTRSDSQHIGIEDYIARIERQALNQELICSLANLNFSLVRGSLSLLIKGHNHQRRTQLLHSASTLQEYLLALL